MSQIFSAVGLLNPVPPTQGGTGITSYVTGDMLYATAANTLGKLAAGSNGQVLTLAGGVPTWAAAAAASPLTTKGDLYTYTTTAARLGVGADTFVLTADSAEASGLKWAAASAGNTTKEFVFDSAQLQALETNSAQLEQLSGATVNVMVRSFDETTEEFASGKLQVPGDVDTSGTVTFRAYVMAKIAAASKNIALTFGHIPLNDSEDFDVSYTDEDSGDIAIGATQDDITEATWTETVSNLGWAANDLVIFRLSRPAASVNNLVDDMYLLSVAIEIPRSV